MTDNVQNAVNHYFDLERYIIRQISFYENCPAKIKLDGLTGILEKIENALERAAAETTIRHEQYNLIEGEAYSEMKLSDRLAEYKKAEQRLLELKLIIESEIEILEAKAKKIKDYFDKKLKNHKKLLKLLSEFLAKEAERQDVEVDLEGGGVTDEDPEPKPFGELEAGRCSVCGRKLSPKGAARIEAGDFAACGSCGAVILRRGL